MESPKKTNRTFWRFTIQIFVFWIKMKPCGILSSYSVLRFAL